MLSNNPPELKAQQTGNAKPVAIEEPVPLMDAGKPIETASTGSGSSTDPGGTDTKPPGAADLEYLV